MDEYIAEMVKEWTWQEVRDLSALARRKGIRKGDLAVDYIGVAAGTLSGWMRDDRDDELPVLTRNALCYVELRIGRMKDVE